MMNIKKYRATTTREALEKIKQDLGENALVLETRQVRTGGFLGLGSGIQIEVSAAAPVAELNSRSANRSKANIHSDQILHRTNETTAPVYGAKNNLMAALTARASMTDEFENAAPNAANNLQSENPSDLSQIEAVELSTEAPRVVHAKNTISKRFLPATETSAADNPIREIELLRAEMREIKFSVNSFANRQNSNSGQNKIDFDLPAEISKSPFYEIFIELTETGITPELARNFVSDIIPQHKKKNIDPNKLAQTALLHAISSTLKFAPDALKLEQSTVLAVIGATGVGKTTTIAKLAARAALYERRRVELVTLDTYRIAAVEQLKTYAEIIGAGCHVVRSVLELDAILRRMSSEAIVLIDTTGKNPHDLADQFEFSDYLKQRAEIRKCLTVQATTNSFDAFAGIRKFEMYGADSLILTKIDETLRPGSLLSVLTESALPIAYLCNGQRVPEDLLVATPETLTNRILGKN